MFVPFNTGYHLAHHVDIGVPFSRLPALQRELEDAGYIQPELEWPSYVALWRHARSGGAATAATGAAAGGAMRTDDGTDTDDTDIDGITGVITSPVTP